jgi:hypothetical protein
MMLAAQVTKQLPTIAAGASAAPQSLLDVLHHYKLRNMQPGKILICLVLLPKLCLPHLPSRLQMAPAKCV